ncbi:hypothetical protein AB0368_11760 [Actinoplanes sp. NPDC051475]|uniref:hypothetical protein n=1 Tax=Actinoplanes sp. NPDC051475 TaxID=3157225 RepID=UPI00344D226B
MVNFFGRDTKPRSITLRLRLWEWLLIILVAINTAWAGAPWAAVPAAILTGLVFGVWRCVQLLGYQLERQQADHAEDEYEVVPN